MGSLHKNILLMPEFLKAPFSVQHFPILYNDLSEGVICSISIYADDATLYLIRHLICGNN